MVKHDPCSTVVALQSRVTSLESRVSENKVDVNEDIKEMKLTVKDLVTASNRIAWMVLTMALTVLGQIIFYLFTKKIA